MTDEEIKSRLDEYPALAGLIEAAFQAGYRAAITEASEELERLMDIQDDHRDSTMDIYDLKRWLGDKGKE